MKKWVLSGLIALGLGVNGCQVEETIISRRLIVPESHLVQKQEPQEKDNIKVSYKLEDLCDTEVKMRDIELYVYIKPSEKLWDYSDYKQELFDHVKEFFKEQQINCKVNFSKTWLHKFNEPNKFGIEIYESKTDMGNRYYTLLLNEKDDNNKQIMSKEKAHILMFNQRGYGATRVGIALINGCWQEHKLDPDMSRQDIESQFKDTYKGYTVKEYYMKGNAANICHEILHCQGLWHPQGFQPAIIKNFEKGVPNMMSYQNMLLGKGHVLGYQLNDLQRHLVHSFITGNNAYKAFIDSEKDLDTYLLNVGQEFGAVY
ncbi:hypothetical protein GOV14_00540 [Candidatus Pacearchaeota archaeon]|nr:hypothetical protein [Candidatus Pacearchaeota archaeon]